MNSDSGVQFVARRRKRPRQEPSTTHSTSTPGPTLPPLAMPPARYAGDGLDFRRPATGPSIPPEEDSEVIDLTNEPDSPELPRRQIPESSRRQPRPPRFGRDIMADVVNLEDEEEEQEPDPPSSPEVQFLSSTVRPPRPPPPARTQSLTASNFWRLLPLPQMFRSTNDPRYRREVPWRAASHLSRGDLETLWIGEDAGGPMDLTINLDNAEWELLGLPPDIDRPERERPGSSYKAPSPAPEGFTRSLAEDDVATCPNCDEELGTGDDTKQQIWVAKQCGHVYCGECATNRSLTRAKKANAKTRPFAKCQVADCGKPVSAPKAMFQVYL